VRIDGIDASDFINEQDELGHLGCVSSARTIAAMAVMAVSTTLMN
jgi:hypothetical protein